MTQSGHLSREKKYFSSTAVMAGQELLLMKSNQILIKNTSYAEGTEDREGHNKHIGTSIPLAWAKADL